MFRCSACTLTLFRRSAAAFGGGLRSSNGSGAAGSVGDGLPEVETPKKADAPTPAADQSKTHIVPEVVLRDLTNAISQAQKTFLSGGGEGTADTYSEAFFGLVNAAYESRFQEEQQVEVEAFVAKRRAHYEDRLNEETEEFKRERREVHDELQRMECDRYKDELIKDVAEFAAQRQKDCEARLKKDVDKYHAALQSYRARQAQQARETAEHSGFGDVEKNLTADVHVTVEQLEADTQLFDFGPGAKGFGNDLTDEEISGYVEGRVKFYETTLQDEIDYYTHRRRAFYEELVQARAVRHAAKVRADTDRFRARRSSYYKERLGSDAIWMAKNFQGHYERCILSCYARQAWLMHRLTPTPDADPIADISKTSFEALSENLPLPKVLDIYATEAIEEVSRDVFLKAARRIAGESPAPPSRRPAPPKSAPKTK